MRMEAPQHTRRQSRARRLAGPLAAVLAAWTFLPAATYGQYTEVFQTWTAMAADTRETQDLRGAPYNVSANAGAEVTVGNLVGAAVGWDAGQAALPRSKPIRLVLLLAG